MKPPLIEIPPQPRSRLRWLPMPFLLRSVHASEATGRAVRVFGSEYASVLQITVGWRSPEDTSAQRRRHEVGAPCGSGARSVRRSRQIPAHLGL